MRSISSSVALAFIFSSSIILGQEFDSSRYKPSTLTGVIETSKKTQKVEATEVDLVGGAASYLVRLTWTGGKRPIENPSRNFLALWLKVKGLPASHVDLFKDELCFKEGEKEYWLPVQDTLVSDITSQLKAGAEISAYIVWLGDVGNERFFFILNGYDEIKKAS